jgi:hypothetical protein
MALSASNTDRRSMPTRERNRDAELYRHRTEPQAPEYALIARMLRDVPELPGALCKRHPGLHDHDEMLTALAVNMCESCPCLIRCSDWVASMPRSESKWLTGVWAGKDYGPSGTGSY